MYYIIIKMNDLKQELLTVSFNSALLQVLLLTF
jgi:hypothetical protein